MWGMWGSEEMMAAMGGFGPEIIAKMEKNYPRRRLGTPRDIANATLFLASDVADDICGQTLSVSGGYSMM